MAGINSSFIASLERALSPGRASTRDEDLLVYSFDGSEFRGKAGAIVWPETKAEVAKIVSMALSAEVDVVPRGGGTSLVGGAVPEGSLVIDLTRLDAIEIDARKKEAHCGAGVRIRELNFALARHGLLFPVIPSSHKVCTIGGAISTNAAGIRSAHFGNMRDWLVSLEVVDGSGNIYETSALDDFCGTEGICGIVVGATLKLVENVTSTSMDEFMFSSNSEMVKKAVEAKADPDVLSVEYIGRLAAEKLGFGKDAVLIVEYRGMRGKNRNAAEISDVWEKRENAYPDLFALGYAYAEDPRVPHNKMAEFLDWLDGNEIPAFGHIGFGVVHPCFKPEWEGKRKEMYALVKTLGGSVSGEHGIGIKKREYVDDEFRMRMKLLKDKYDKKRIMNRGKVIG